MMRAKIWLFMLMMLWVTSCAQGMAEIKPPDIRFGEDVCADCNMIISDPRFASAYAHEISQGRYASLAFDDMGDMLAHAQKNPEHKIVAWYVHDYTSQEWIDAEQAHFVLSESIRSPMGYGIAAHATLDGAESMAATIEGEIVDWTELSGMELRADHLHTDHENDHDH
jgi:copper chaperone NosL